MQLYSNKTLFKENKRLTHGPALKELQGNKREGSWVFKESHGAELPHPPALANLLHEGKILVSLS